MPWQLATAEVVGEQTPEGHYAYPIVVVLVPRQTGKSTWLFDYLIGRCLVHPDYRAAYTAQTGQAAAERFGERMTDLAGTLIRPSCRMFRSSGRERMSFPRGSFLRAFPPRDGALRGSALDAVVIDEAQEVDDLQGHALDMTCLPTFTTRPRRQLILIGTAGNDTSAYLARYLALARAGAEGVALIEYGAAEDDDVTDPALWPRVHPGLAAGLTDTDALASALTVMGPEAFAREYMCVWQSGGSRVIAADLWKSAADHLAVPAEAAPVLAVDVAVDRSAAAIVAAWPDTLGRTVVEVIDYAPGVAWAAPRLLELAALHHPPIIVADSVGPVLTVTDEATRLGLDITTTSTKDYLTACSGFLDRLPADHPARVLHRGDPALTAAAAGARRRTVGDGWAWARRSVTAEVSPLIAASLAAWADQRRPAAPVRPEVYAE